MKLDPSKIPDGLVERAAMAMQGANAISQLKDIPWRTIVDPERAHWIFLAKTALLAISIHIDQWPILKLDQE